MLGLVFLATTRQLSAVQAVVNLAEDWSAPRLSDRGCLTHILSSFLLSVRCQAVVSLVLVALFYETLFPKPSALGQGRTLFPKQSVWARVALAKVVTGDGSRSAPLPILG
jgi:hypothetical protein